jgi:hypothetical protein
MSIVGEAYERSLQKKISTLQDKAKEYDETARNARWNNRMGDASYYEGLATGIRTAIVVLNEM